MDVLKNKKAKFDIHIKKYNIIYIDPAWHFKTYSDKGNKDLISIIIP